MLRKLAFFTLFTTIFAIPLWALAQQPTLPPTPAPFLLTTTPTTPFIPTLPPAFSPTIVGGSPANTVLEYGDTVSGALDTSYAPAVFKFSGHSGDLIAVQINSFNYGLRVSVHGSSGVVLGMDTSGGPYDPMQGYTTSVLPFNLPADDSYSIWLENQSGNSGTYTLSLSTPPLNSAPFGQAVEGDLTAEQSFAYYCFTGKAGDRVTIALTSTDFDTFLMAAPFGVPGASIQVNNNNAGGDSALISPYTLPQDGLYIIAVTSSSGTASGHYSLLLSQLELQPLTYGDAVQAEFTSQISAFYYTFEAKTSDDITVRVDSQNGLDTQLALLDVYNNVLMTDDDSANGFDPEILNLLIPQNGTYTIKLSPFKVGDTGTVILSLQNLPTLSLDVGAQQVRLGSKYPVAYFSFNGVANQRVRLRFNMECNCNPSVNVSQNDQSIGVISMSGLPVVTAEFVVPASGEVHIEVTSFSDMRIQLSLERISS